MGQIEIVNSLVMATVGLANRGYASIQNSNNGVWFCLIIRV